MLTRKHSSRIRTVRLPTVRVLPPLGVSTGGWISPRVKKFSSDDNQMSVTGGGPTEYHQISAAGGWRPHTTPSPRHYQMSVAGDCGPPRTWDLRFGNNEEKYMK